MPRRVHLAFALILLLVLAPLAGATCGINCLASTPHHPIHLAMSQQPHCVRASACCHSSGPGICAATRAPEAVAAVLSANSATPDAPALPIVAAVSPSQNPRTLVVRSIDSSPPGQPLASSHIPLRV